LIVGASKLHCVTPHPVVKTTVILVTTCCLKCKDMATVEGEFQNGVFKDIVPTRHITRYSRGKNKTWHCWCGGEVKIFVPKSVKYLEGFLNYYIA